MTGKQTLDWAWNNRGGFLIESEMQDIARDPETRLFVLLVRCGNGRFLAPAQDVETFTTIIRQHAEMTDKHKDLDAQFCPSTYVRDVSIPAGYEPGQTHPNSARPYQAPRVPVNLCGGVKAITQDSRDLEDCHSDADPGL